MSTFSAVRFVNNMTTIGYPICTQISIYSIDETILVVEDPDEMDLEWEGVTPSLEVNALDNISHLAHRLGRMQI